jgi:Zn-dependent peptidase ImmA (M78 family)
MGKYKRKTERSLKFTTEVMENINRRQEAGESNRSIAEYFRVPESTLRKRLRMGTVPTSLDYDSRLLTFQAWSLYANQPVRDVLRCLVEEL